MSTAERCKEGSQVWSAKRDTPGSWFKRPGTPAGVPGKGLFVTRGIARAARSTPGYAPCTAPRCQKEN